MCTGQPSGDSGGGCACARGGEGGGGRVCGAVGGTAAQHSGQQRGRQLHLPHRETLPQRLPLRGRHRALGNSQRHSRHRQTPHPRQTARHVKLYITN